MSMIAANRDTLLARLPSGSALHGAAVGMIDAAINFAAKSTEIWKSAELTNAGKLQRVREAAPAALRAYGVAFGQVKRAKDQVEARWRELQSPTYDPTNAAAAIERAEIRSYLRSMDPLSLAVVARTTTDPRFLEAMLSAPPELSGLVGPNMNDIGEETAHRYLKLLHGSVVDDLEKQEEMIEAAEAIGQIALDDIKSTASLGDAEVEAMQKTGAPWLKKEGDQIVRVRPGEEPLYAPATAGEIATGYYFSNFDAWARANGYASGEAFKAQDQARKRAAA